MKTAFLFPGQGAQHSSMAQDLHQESSGVRTLFEACSNVVGKDMATLLFEADETTLMQTENTQIAVMLASLAAACVLKERGITPALVAGFSLGEYAALVVADVLSLEDACTLVMQRSAFMEACAQDIARHYQDEGSLGMTAILGMHPNEICTALTEWGIPNVHLAMYNSPIQGVVAGTEHARTQACEKLRTLGARKCIPLKVSGPFHTPLMRAAREQFAEVAARVAFKQPRIPVFTNVHGAQLHTGDDIRSMCLDQLVSPVRWLDEQDTLIQEKPQQVLEVGPGSVLAGLWKAWRSTKDDESIPLCKTAGTMEHIQSI